MLVIIYNWFILTITVKRIGIPLSAHFVVPIYMFCIGLMMAELWSKHVALMWNDIAYFYHCVDIRGLLEKYPTFGREKETGLLGALDT